LGRPANIASKLTDDANKKEETIDLIKLNVAYLRGGKLTYYEEFPHLFTQNFAFNQQRNLMVHRDPTFHSFYTIARKHVTKAATPPIMMTKRVYDGFRQARPNAPCLVNRWIAPVNVSIAEYTEQAYGGDVIYTAFQE
jgi:hypothetical protein